MRKKKKDDITAIVLSALFTAIIAVCAQIQIPTPFFTITLQTFAVALCGYTSGVKYSLLSVVAYILLGIAGAPVFSGFCGGFHDIVEPQGGFIIAFPILAVLCGLSFKFKKDLQKIGIGIIGVMVTYVIGVSYFVFMATDKNSFGAAALLFFGVFIKDIVLCVVSFYFSRVIRKRLTKIKKQG